MIRACTFQKKKKKKSKKKEAQWYVRVWYLAPLGTHVTFWGLFIAFICHCGFLWDFHEFSSLSHSYFAFGVSRVHERVLWDPMFLRSWLICIRYERWLTFLLGPLDHYLTHHSIIGDLTILYCTDLGLSSFLPLSYCLILYLITSFQIFVPPLSIPYILTHISGSIPSTHHLNVSLIVWPLIFPLVSISTFSLVTFKSLAHEIFYMHYILYTRV